MKSRGICTGLMCLWVVATSGCLVGELSGIPCGKDDQCPTEHFCDIPVGSCVFDAEGSGAPDVNVPGVIDNGEFTISPFVPPDIRTPLKLVLENRGGQSADNLDVELTRLACMSLEFDESDIPDSIEAGARVEIDFSVAPVSCVTPSIQDWFVFYSGRAGRGTFNINITRDP